MRVIFAGGGTGGHLIPALAIAEKLKVRIAPQFESDFIFVGTRRGLEYRMREKLGYPLELINIRGMARRLTLSNLLVPFLLIGAVIKSMLLISRFNPVIVIGTGGYVMGPVLLAAAIMRRPRVIQEQNSYPGVTTRQLAAHVDRVFLGFAEASKHLGHRARTVVTGNPVKEVIGKISKAEGRAYFEIKADKTNVILILGGSQGAATINRNILQHLDTFPDNYHLIWQSGERDYKEVAARAGGKVFGRSLFSFTDRIEMAYAAADLVIARAGALTLAEIAAAGLPSILVPYPFAAGDHQRKNAASFTARGAAVMIDDSRLGAVSLPAEAVAIFAQGRHTGMTQAVGSMKEPHDRGAAERICDEILNLMERKGKAS